MGMSPKHIVKQSVNNVLSRFDLELIRRSSDASNYIPFRSTLAAAKKAGMNLGEFIDLKFNVPGSTQSTIDAMAKAGVFHNSIKRVVEIGPGTGRYLEKVLERSRPVSYEIYETAPDWRKRLQDLFTVVAHAPDGQTLAQSATGSADLVHAHKVFSSLRVSTAIHYLEEMARVAADDGWVVFDVLTESCFSEEELKKWYASGVSYANSMLPRQFLVNRLGECGLHLVSEFFIPMLPGKTHYFIFRKGRIRPLKGNGRAVSARGSRQTHSSRKK